MRTLLALVRGFKGHPSHPPLTDVSIGAYTVGFVATIVAWMGLETPHTVRAAFVAVVVGLLVSIATIVTGFIDYLRIPRGTPLWNATTIHWMAMLLANAGFIVTAALLWTDFDRSVSLATGIVTILSFALLTLGGWIGGALVFVYGMRVVSEGDKPARDAILKPEFPPE